MKTAARAPADISLRMEVARALLGPLTFSGTQADLDCPGAALHTVKDGRRARLFLDGAPTVTCFHASCAGRIAIVNADLRAKIALAESWANHPPRTLRKWFPQTAATAWAPLRDRYWKKMGREILQAANRNPVTTADLWEASPVQLPTEPADHFKLFLKNLWAPTEIIWCGELFDSGKAWHAKNFRTVEEWLAHGAAPGPLTCPWSFAPGAISRCKEQTAARRFLVLESDKLTETETASVFWWLKEKMLLRLRAVVHSGNKSLHGWFELPIFNLDELQDALPHAGFDPKLFSPSQPCRLPGWQRTDKAALLQRLLFLDRRDL